MQTDEIAAVLACVLDIALECGEVSRDTSSLGTVKGNFDAVCGTTVSKIDQSMVDLARFVPHKSMGANHLANIRRRHVADKEEISFPIECACVGVR